MLETGLADTVENDGILILGGILETQAESVIQAAKNAGLKHIDTLQDEDWVVLVFKRKQIDPSSRPDCGPAPSGGFDPARFVGRIAQFDPTKLDRVRHFGSNRNVWIGFLMPD